MKTKKGLETVGAFSLMELMIVISIMLLLAGLLIAALPGVQNRVNRARVESFFAELESGLSSYHVDNGIYPRNDATGDRDVSGLLGSRILYKNLSGDFNEDGRVDDEEKVYVPKLDFESNRNKKSRRSTAYAGAYAVMDAFGNPVRYLCDPPNLKPSERKTYNPDYDLWSIVDTDPKDSGDFSTQARYITNWQSN